MSDTAGVRCVEGTLDRAAATLMHEHAVAGDVVSVAGLQVGSVLDHPIAPGIDTALLRVSDRWCTVEAFNAAAEHQLAGADAAAAGSA